MSYYCVFGHYEYHIILPNYMNTFEKILNMIKYKKNNKKQIDYSKHAHITFIQQNLHQI